MGSWRPAPCGVVLGQQLDELYGAERPNDGTIASGAHTRQNPSSDHEPQQTPTGVWVDARDVYDYPAGGLDSRELLDIIRASRDRRVLYAIAADDRGRPQMWSSYPARGVPPFTWRAYGGPNPHSGHGHLSFVDEHRGDTRPWRIRRASTGWPTPTAVDSAPTTRPAPTTTRKASRMVLVTPDGVRMFLTDGLHVQHVADDAQLIERCRLLRIDPRKPARITSATLAGLIHLTAR